jgi:hypothetical protein
VHRLEPVVSVSDGDPEAVDDREIHLAPAQQREADIGLGLYELELHVGMAGAEPGEGPRQEGRVGTSEGSQPHATGLESPDGVELRLRGREMLEHGFDVTGEQAPSVGQRDGPDGSVQQREPDLVLEGSDLLGNRGLRGAELLGRT